MNSLFARLLRSYALVLFTAIFVIATAVTYLYSESVFRARTEELVETGQRLARRVEQGALLNPVRFAAYVDGTAQSLGSGIAIVDRNIFVLVSTFTPAQAQQLRLREADVAAVFQDGQIVTRTGYEEAVGEAVVTAIIPIRTAQGIVGAVILHAPVRGTNQAIQSALRILLYSGILAAAAGVLMSYVLSRRIARPIREITQASLEMARGRFDRRVSTREKGELGALGAAFNRLASQLGATISELRQAQKNMESILTGMSDGVVAVNVEGRIIAANPAAGRLLGQEAPVRSQRMAEAESFQALWPHYERALAGENASAEIAVRDKVLLLNVTPLSDDDGSITGAVGILHDISERHRLDRMRRDFLANVSHELRTPLTSIRGFAQAILEGMVTDQQQVRRYLQVIMDEGLRLIRLVNTILDLSRIEAKAVSLQLEALPLGEVLEDVVESMEPVCRDRGVRVELDLDPGAVVSGDRDRMAQIFLNLIDNSVRHSPSGGTIRVRLERSDGEVVVTVADEGPGIPEEELPYIWERFHKVDKSRRSERGAGTGLGLVIVKELVEMHGGAVAACNGEGGGAVFTVRFPVETAPAAAEAS